LSFLLLSVLWTFSLVVWLWFPLLLWMPLSLFLLLEKLYY